MRILELLLVIAIALAVLTLYVNPKHRPTLFHLLPALSLILVVLQIFIENSRWQMYPAYLFSGVLFIFTAKYLSYLKDSRDRDTISDRKGLRYSGAVISTLLLILIALPPLAFPVFELPQPTGPYQVGIRHDFFIDTSRAELATPDTSDFREISAQVWYPAVANDKRAVKYWVNARQQSEVITQFWGGLPSFLFSHFSLVETHSYLNAEIPAGEHSFPVLIFNHGSIGLPSLHTALMEELASHGYVIFSIGHADYIPFFLLPDGGIKAFDPDNSHLKQKMSENENPQVKDLARRLMHSNDTNEQQELLGQFLDLNPANQASTRWWADDISFTIDQLAEINTDQGFFHEKLDLKRLGVLGVSFGGAASIQACIQDERVKAAVSVDCIQFGDFLVKDPHQPMMMISSDQWKGLNNLFLDIKQNPLFLVHVNGTRHQNFSDLYLWGTMLKQMLGTIDGARCQNIQNLYIRAFFDKYLNDTDSTILYGPSSDYPEVSIEVRNVSI
jgi:predicted dienelactone hydrolase